ncbi:MAG: hypothetical protein HYZ58_06845 [Acidobacteria bacterium]|nr:hypothetical protein [Acidobacteriota bacterium]MBI3262851.1 hypothetical protein [Acidobacteriota bacterium]
MRTASLLSSLGLALALSACTSFYEIPVETPIQPKLDVAPFQRVFIVGFITGGTDDVDANLETVRLLRSQLRTKSTLKVVDADVLPLNEIAAEQRQGEPDSSTATTDGGATNGNHRQGEPIKIKDEKELEGYEHIFANVEFWKKLGEEYQNPLIVTGTVFFTPHSRSGYVQREQEVYDPLGRRRVVPVRAYMERKGFILGPKFVFIDGRTGTTLYSERFREEILYNAQNSTPALSSYFELMDRIIPSFLSTLSAQKIRGTRILLK